MSRKRAKDDKPLYADNFWAEGLGWSPAILAAAQAMYGRLRIVDGLSIPWDDLSVDAVDHYCIAARHAVRAFNRAAEAPL